MGKPTLEEFLEKLMEISKRIYLHGEGQYTVEVRSSIEKGEKETIIRAGENFRFKEKIVDSESKKK